MKKTGGRINIAWKLSIAFFALFLCLQAVVVFSIELFGDDYYYATFTDSGEFFVSENIRHFKEVNGRVLVHLFDELLLADKTLTLFGVALLSAIGCVVFFSAANASNAHKDGFFTKRFAYSLVITSFLFATLHLDILRESVYWSTGAANYLFPLALLLIFIYLSLRCVDMGKGGAPLIILIALLVGQSTEQASAAALAVCFYFLMRSVFSKRDKKEKRRLTVIFASALFFAAICFAILFFAPGNSERVKYYPEFYNMTLATRISGNISRVVNLNIGERGSTVLFSLLLLTLPLYVYRKLKAQGNKKWAGFMRITAICSAVGWLFYVALLISHTGKALFWQVTFLYLGACCIAMLLGMLVLFIRNTDFLAPAFCALAAVLQLAMLFSPEIGARTCLCSAVLLFVPVASACSSLLESISKKRAAAMLAALAVVSVGFMTFRAQRYLENSKAHAQTRENLEGFTAGEELVFVIPKHDRYRYVLPYDSTYFEYWYKMCHHLPEDTVIKYEQYK